LYLVLQPEPNTADESSGPIDFNAFGVIIATHDGPPMPVVLPKIGTFICGLAITSSILLSI
jgi:hypothetical protein